MGTDSVVFCYDQGVNQVARESSGLLDDTAKRIIEALQEDGRRSYASIAGSVGLSEAAVRQRVARLTEAGIMQIVAVTNPLTLGFRRQALIGLRADGDLRKIADEIAGIAEVDYVVITAGSFDIICEVVCEDDEHLLKVLNDQVRVVEGVRDTETLVYLQLTKQTYSWGTR
jgi:Lrp/AsnC family transcriptional regulator for asnA, asnC and gidA